MKIPYPASKTLADVIPPTTKTSYLKILLVFPSTFKNFLLRCTTNWQQSWMPTTWTLLAHSPQKPVLLKTPTCWPSLQDALVAMITNLQTLNALTCTKLLCTRILFQRDQCWNYWTWETVKSVLNRPWWINLFKVCTLEILVTSRLLPTSSTRLLSETSMKTWAICKCNTRPLEDKPPSTWSRQSKTNTSKPSLNFTLTSEEPTTQ
jgi:hypothetical protein